MNITRPQNNYRAIARPIMLVAACISFLLASCKKNELVPFEQKAANRIATYTVTNAQEVINGVVDDADNTITVYVPYYISIDFIVPKITLHEGATLIDAAGNNIDIREDLEPVPFDTVGYKYRVKDDNNNIRQYTLVTKILPHQDALKVGYFRQYDDNGNVTADDTSKKEAVVNSRITIYGNLESSAKSAKLTLYNKATNAEVPNALKLFDVGRYPDIHYISMDISAEVDSGYYYIKVEHQGRTATLPTIHLTYRKPFFGFLPKPLKQGDTVTLPVVGPQASEAVSGINTGIKRAFITIIKQWLVTKPANFPDELYGKYIELEIISQSRTEVKFKFPEIIPPGIYEVNMGASSGNIQYTGFGIYFDFNAEAWGNNNLLAGMPYANFEISAK